MSRRLGPGDVTIVDDSIADPAPRPGSIGHELYTIPAPDPRPKAPVVILPVITRLDHPPDRMLEGAVGELEGVVIAGYRKRDGALYFASSYADGGDALWLLEACKQALLRAGNAV